MSSVDSSALTVKGTRAYHRRVRTAASFLREEVSSPPSRAILLDPEVGALGSSFSPRAQWAAPDIPEFPGSDEEGPATILAAGLLGDTSVLVLEGTLSLYEGHTPREVVFPVRMLAEAGVDTMLFATTAGSLRPKIAPGELVLTTDHINFLGVNPLVGPNLEDWGPRFPDMTEPYAPALRHWAETVAQDEGFSLRKGVYFAMLGPNHGTHAEYRMARMLGADLAGMNTVPEVIAARHMGVDVASVSVITERLLPSASGEERAVEGLDVARSRLPDLFEGVLTGVKSGEKPR